MHALSAFGGKRGDTDRALSAAWYIQQYLFGCYGFCKIAGLIGIASAQNAGIICDKL